MQDEPRNGTVSKPGAESPSGAVSRPATPARPGLWSGGQVAFFDHRCSDPSSNGTTEFYVSAPCIVLVRAGAFWTASAQGAALGDAATVVFRNATAPYTVRDVPGARSESTTVRVASAAMRELIADADPAAADLETPTFRIASAGLPARAALLHEMLLRELARSPAPDPLVVEESAMALVAGIIGSAYGGRPRPPATARVTSGARERVAAAQEYLALHCCERVRLGDVAAAAGCTRWHLARAFRATLGTSLGRHLGALRLRAALRRVVETRDDLTSVALGCGFYDHSHFSSTFRRAFGVSPSTVRRRGTSDARRLMDEPPTS